MPHNTTHELRLFSFFEGCDDDERSWLENTHPAMFKVEEEEEEE
jgi:hypothetical protein